MGRWLICHSFSSPRLLAGLSVLASIALSASAHAQFVTFESGQVRPLAMNASGTKLYAVNTPDDRIEVFDINATGDLTHSTSVSVGLEPVALAVRPNGTQLWVVNHLSDSISIVDLTGAVPHVIRTLLVGDEPRDIIFAGGDRAFITTAHRGQNTPLQPTIITELTTAAPVNTGRADVWVFDAANLGATLEGVPLTRITLFTDTPRALAASPDGSTVYAAGFHTGNQTTTVSEGVVCNDGNLNNNTPAPACTIMSSSYPGGLPNPEKSSDNVNRPETGLVVKFNQGANQWRDQLNRNWNNAVKFSLPDRDVFSIDADANPVPIPVVGPTAFFAGVGTVLFNMVTNPNSGNIYVSNTDARNEVRFEGPGIIGGSTVRSHLHEARISVISGTSVLPRHLNKHISAQPQGYLTNPTQAGIKDASLAIPTGMTLTSDGNTLYVAAFGSSKVGVYDTTQLELDTFDPLAVPQITVSGGGPSGLVLNEAKSRLYVFTRFDNAVSVINTSTNMQIDHLLVYNPEPAEVVNGRPFLYDAFLTSSNGEASCASCHIFGDFDSLGWDLGNPDDVVTPNLNPFRVTDPLGTSFPDHHPMKGPMTTQSLRGMANHGPMHWRGDRSGANNPSGSALDEDAAFKKFNVAFAGLLGRSGPLTAPQMQAFTDFILEVTYPPNPIRALNDSLTGDQAAGRNFYFNSGNGGNSDVFQPCNGCHVLDRAAGFFGSDGFSSFENETQLLKVAHLRNLYQKVGMFGMPAIQFVNAGDNGNKGNQIRGFGFLHDGSIDTIFRFHNAVVFNQNVPPFGDINPGGFLNGTAGDPLRRQVESFMLVFDSNLAPIVGQQVTLSSTNGATVDARIDLLIAQAGSDYFPGSRHCDLIVKGVVGGEPRGWLYQPGSTSFRSDRIAEPLITDNTLRSFATAGQELTYTCVPPGNGQRSGIDRDLDGTLDGDEGSTSTACGSTPAGGCKSPTKSLLQIKTSSGREKLNWKWLKGAQTDLSELGDPVAGTTEYRLCVYSGTADNLVMELVVPPALDCGGEDCWKPSGTTGFKYRDATLSQSGTQRIVLRAGDPGKAKVMVKGKGGSLPVPVIPPTGLEFPVTVQLQNSDNECWEADYNSGETIKNESTEFKAKF